MSDIKHVGGKAPGHLKAGGRVKGTPNKATQSLREICEKHGVNPFEAMVMIAVQEQDVDKKFDKLERILPYLEAKRTSVALSNDGDTGFKIIVEDYRSKNE